MAEPASARRKRLFEQFRRKLERLSADEIQHMLDRRQIRSADRIALAEAMIKERREGGRRRAAAEQAGAGPLAALAARGAGNGADEAPESGQDAESGAAAKAETVPIARQVGRMLGIGIGVASIAALAIFAIRR